MMHDGEKSDPAIVAAKPTNKAVLPAAELVEPRAGTKRNADEQSTLRTQGRERVSQALDRVRQAARQRKKERFTALLHHITVDTLRTAFLALKRKAAAGVDGLTWQDYEADLEPRLEVLHNRVQRGAYRPQPSRRTHIPKADGKQRPLAIAALEDKIVQGATTMVLNAVYEEEFLGFSYGFRPGRGPHDALDALVVGIAGRKVNHILDADIRSFFDSVDQTWLVRFVEHRIGDPRIIRLIRKWLKAGILEDGVVTVADRGTGQGSVISPLLANIYLHYALDLWAERWRRREATGDMIIVRYADDLVVGFEHETDAHRFLDAMRVRFEEFALSLHPDKTRLIEFGRFAAVRRAKGGLGRPETFNFLGFTFICGKSLRGNFLILRRSRRDRVRAKLQEIKEELRQRRHQSIPDQGRWLAQVVGGFFAYHAVPTNFDALGLFRRCVTVLWKQSLQRRSQRADLTWERVRRMADDWLPTPKILHPWPNVRFAVKHSR
ncbi:MAG: group II intron reverse transcriptase/maturase [Alphaproteobacteria bacterium]|nr:group II intron reverse transcriptase/maturase [Alphaproteobacteria bacterium]